MGGDGGRNALQITLDEGANANSSDAIRKLSGTLGNGRRDCAQGWRRGRGDGRGGEKLEALYEVPFCPRRWNR